MANDRYQRVIHRRLDARVGTEGPGRCAERVPNTISWEPPSTPFTAAQVGVTWKVLARAERLGTISKLRQGVYISSEALATLLGDQQLAQDWHLIRPQRTAGARAATHDQAGHSAGGASRIPRRPELSSEVLRTAHLIAALAEQVSRPELIASHETAALALRIPLLDEAAAASGPVRLTVPRRSQRGRTGGPNVVERAISGSDVSAAPSPFGALVVTSAERTAVDIAARGDLVAALMAADHVTRAGIPARLLRGEVPDVRLRAARRALVDAADRAELRRGSAAVSRMLHFADPRREAASESASFAVMVEAGLPLPVPQQRFETPLGIYFSDFWWEEYMLAGECDGRLKYLAAPDAESQAAADARRIAEKDRQEALAEIGVNMVRWWAGDALAWPERLTEKVSDALRRCGWDGTRGL